MASPASKSFKPRQVTRPRDQVESQLREAILDGRFAQGNKLPPETELAQQFGVSRPTVREALGALVSAGLIRKIPGVAGGSFVNTLGSFDTLIGVDRDNFDRGLNQLAVEEQRPQTVFEEVERVGAETEHRVDDGDARPAGRLIGAGQTSADMGDRSGLKERAPRYRRHGNSPRRASRRKPDVCTCVSCGASPSAARATPSR